MARDRRHRARRRAAARGLRRTLAAAVVVAVVVGVAAGAVAQIGPASRPYERAVDASYAQLASAQAAPSAATGQALHAAVAAAPGDDRASLFTALDAAVAASETQAAALAQTTPPDPDGGAAPWCQRALDRRHQAAQAVQAAFEGVVGGRTGAAPVELATAQAELAGVGAQLATADAAWARCRRLVRAAPGHARLAPSVWAAQPGAWSAAALGAAVAAAASSPTLAAQHHLALAALTTEPAAASDTGGVAVLPPATSLAVDVAVVDAGNVDERGVRLAVTGAGRPAGRRLSLAAGRSLAVRVAGLPVTPGQTYTLTVTATDPASGASAQLSVPISLTPFPTFAVLTASANPAPAGRAVSFTAAFTTTGSRVTGRAAFLDDGVPLAGCTAVPIRGGQAVCQVATLTPGVHPITVSYAGGGDQAATVSAPVNETVTARRAARAKSARA